jgi:hypothetical protein
MKIKTSHSSTNKHNSNYLKKSINRAFGDQNISQFDCENNVKSTKNSDLNYNNSLNSKNLLNMLKKTHLNSSMNLR